MVRVSIRAFAALAATAAIATAALCACSALLSFDDLLPQPSAPGDDAGDAGDADADAFACKPGFGDCDDAAATRCATDLTKPENCGACGRTCGGGRCIANGACEAIILATTPTAQAIVVDGAWVYWTNSVANNDGGIMKVGVDGGDVALVIEEPARPFGLAKDDVFLYWTSINNGNVRRIAKGGGPRELVANGGGGGTGELVVSHRMVFWTHRTTSEGQIFAAPANGGGPVSTIDTTLSSPQGIAADETNVYWATTTDGRIHQHSRSGPEVAAQIDSPGGMPRHLAIDADHHIYWTSGDTASVYSALIPLGNSTTTIFAGGGPRQTNGIAVDGTYVYWLTDTLLKRAPKAGGPAATLVALGTNQFGKELTLDDANVYFTISVTPAQGGAASALIAKTPK